MQEVGSNDGCFLEEQIKQLLVHMLQGKVGQVGQVQHQSSDLQDLPAFLFVLQVSFLCGNFHIGSMTR